MIDRPDHYAKAPTPAGESYRTHTRELLAKDHDN